MLYNEQQNRRTFNSFKECWDQRLSTVTTLYNEATSKMIEEYLGLMEVMERRSNQCSGLCTAPSNFWFTLPFLSI
jgi:hypothetical protein